MLTVARVLGLLAGLLHVYIFWLEALRWTHPQTRAVFGTTPDFAEASKELAYNQGWYNLFLAVEAVLGAALAPGAVGKALLAFGLGSMLAAALVLVTRDRKRLRSAAIQGTVPLLGLLALLAA